VFLKCKIADEEEVEDYYVGYVFNAIEVVDAAYDAGIFGL